ncbi:MAG: adenylate/guanylate cyclase domain-containing protein [Planctomycetes bacterium]|nr:adenylate/guanylate cyclase domain-containing protein [Planctomycetota bacterium]
MGIGIHTGPALVGCVGAELAAGGGKTRVRRELTAIGETINLAQRLEQLTKAKGGPILLSEATQGRLRDLSRLESLGPQGLEGFEGQVLVYRARA